MVNVLKFRMLLSSCSQIKYSQTCLKQSLKKKTKIGFQDQLLLDASQKYYRMLQGEHSAILSIFIKLPFVTKTFVLSIFEWPLKTGLTVMVFRAEIHKMLVRIVNRKDPDQTAV